MNRPLADLCQPIIATAKKAKKKPVITNSVPSVSTHLPPPVFGFCLVASLLTTPLPCYTRHQQLAHEGNLLMLKNINQSNVQYNCHHKRGLQCKFQLHCPVLINGDGKNKLNLSKSWLTNQHSQECSAKTSIQLPHIDRNDDDNPDDVKMPAALVLYQNIKEEMKVKMEELAIAHRTMLPPKVWHQVWHWANEAHGGNWQGLKDNQVTQLVRKTCNKAGMGDNIGTVENLPEYNRMKDSDRPFLHWTICLPHTKGKVNMRAMMYANPKLLGLLNGDVHIFVDATFACALHPFYQCLIIMVFNPSTNAYEPVIYTLMTHKFEELYMHAINEVKVLTKVRYVSSDPLTNPNYQT
jgi:hypothetical protein